MPNTSGTSDIFTQNGHHPPSQILSEETLNIPHPKTAPEDTEIGTQLESSSALTTEWSSITKELIDNLPRVWARGLLYFLVVFVAIALPWAMLSKVDETGTARGRLEPKGKTVRLDAPVAGTVAAIKVKEGTQVKAGQSLVELESELVSAQLQEIQRKLEGQQNRLAQLELLKNQMTLAIRTQQQQNQAQQLEKLAQVEQARQNFDALKTVYNFQKEEKQAKVKQAQQALDSSKAAYELAEVRLKGAKEKVPRYKKAFQDGAMSLDRFNEAEQLTKENYKHLMRAQSDISQAKSSLEEQQSSYERTIRQAQSDIQQAQLRLKEQERSYQSLIHTGKLAALKTEEELKNLETQITSLNAEIAQSKSQITSLEFQLKQRVIKAPESGTIFQLSVQRPGAVVQPKDMIAEIAPQGIFLILKAQMATTESGSLRVGMPVKMKFDAYPFQDYGIVEGKLTQISPTSKVTETNQGAIATFDLEIELQQNCIQSANTCVALSPGQTATAEVIVRQRRIIDFVLDPFKKLQKGGLEL
jgi:hemolysin D